MSAGGRCRHCGRPWAEAAVHCFGCGRLRVSTSCARHRDSVAVRACLVCGTTLCPVCLRGGRHTPACAEHGHVRLMQGWAEVARTPDEPSGVLLVERLLSHGLEATLLSQKDRWHVVTFGGLAVVRVLVPAAQYREAEQLLAGGEAGPRAAG